MATSLRDLTLLLQHETRYASTAARRDALNALGPLGRALDRLTADGLDVKVHAERETHVHDLVEACHASSTPELTAEAPSGHLTDLAGAVSDLIGVMREELGRDERWAITGDLAETARVLTLNASDDPAIPPAADLRWTHRAARTVCIAALRDPASVRARAILDRAVPAHTPPTQHPTMHVAAESLLTISDRLRHVAAGRAEPPLLVEVFAATRAAESTARFGAAILAGLRGQDEARTDPVVEVWRNARVALRPFADAALAAPGVKGTPEHDLARHAVTVHLGLQSGFGQPAQYQFATDALKDLQRMLHELPELADRLVIALGRSAERGDLHALASRLPYRHDRMADHLNNRPVLARRDDLANTGEELALAAGLSACLAVDVTNTTGAHPAPDGLVAANMIRAEQQNTPVERWRPLGRAIDPVLTRDPSWPRLATAIERAHTANVDVAAELPRLAKKLPPDDERPAADLLYRLLHDNPAVRTALPPQGYRTADIPPSSRHTPPVVAPTSDPPCR